MKDIADAAKTSLPPEHLEEIAKALRFRQADQVVSALWPLARQYGMSKLARDTGISRTQLYRIFGDSPNPEFNTMLQLLNVFGVRLSVSVNQGLGETP